MGFEALAQEITSVAELNLAVDSLVECAEHMLTEMEIPKGCQMVDVIHHLSSASQVLAKLSD